MDIGVLSAITFLPLAGAVVIILLPRDMKKTARWLAFGFSLAVLVLAIWLWFQFQTCEPSEAGYCFEEQTTWFGMINANWHVGVDGLSVPLVLLTALLTPLAVLISFEIEDRVHMYMSLFLMLEMGMMGVFVSLDLIIFFIFWEIGLVPMYFLINIWGSANKEYASFKFFIYTMGGSLGLLLSIQLIGLTTGTFDIPTLAGIWPDFTPEGGTLFGLGIETIKTITFWAFFVAFAIKVPIWPFHTWLPDAHTEAPTAGSMILAGVLLKLGAYGFLRLVLPFFPEQAARFAGTIGVLAVLAIIMGALASFGQTDFKRLVAYSSVNHMGFVVLGIAAAAYVYGGRGGDSQSAIMALNGAVLQMFNHGLSAAAMFLLVGALYHKAHTRDLTRFGGVWVIAPVYGGILLFSSMASLGLPGLNGFVSEYMVVQGAWPIFTLYTALAMIGLFFTGAYILKGIQKVLHGPVKDEWKGHNLEIEVREVVAIAPLLVLMLVIGVWPNWLVSVINQAVSRLLGA